jgi:hypothetical protein
MLKRKHVLRGGIDGERRAATAWGIRGRRRGGAGRPDPPPRAHGGEHGGCTGWSDVTPAFLAPNKSPNKSRVFSKLSR